MEISTGRNSQVAGAICKQRSCGLCGLRKWLVSHQQLPMFMTQVYGWHCDAQRNSIPKRDQVETKNETHETYTTRKCICVHCTMVHVWYMIIHVSRMYIWKFLSVYLCIYIACDIVCIYLWYDIVSFDNDNDNDEDSDNANGTYKLILIIIIY